MGVVIGRRAASDDDDGESDSNSANVDLAIITQSVAVPSQGKRKKALASIMRAPPRVQFSHWHKVRNSGKCASASKS